jgi:hypothetical protein
VRGLRVILNATLTGFEAGVVAAGISKPATHIMRGSRMGRGRQKAKHTKIARELKYDVHSVNYGALQRELGHPSDDAYVDKWADEYKDEDEDETSAVSSSQA